MKLIRIAFALLLVAILASASVAAQWLNYPAPGVPRLPNGRPDVNAPAPRTADGKPDLTGVWKSASPPARVVNIGQELQPGEIQPWAETLFLQRVRSARVDIPLTQCLPLSIPFHNLFNLISVVQTPSLTMILYEHRGSPPRYVFTDGRLLPQEPNPTWFGYSVAKWEDDTFVITTAGFNDKGWLDTGGHPQTESLRLTERLHRRDFGHIDLEMILDDPKVFRKPVSVNTELVANPDTQLLEDVCENERDRSHLVSSEAIKLSELTLGRYAGAYDLGAGRQVIVEAKDDSVIVHGINEPPIPLVVQSETQFISSFTTNGFEFVVDTSGNVTDLIIRGANGEQKASRRSTGERGK